MELKVFHNQLKELSKNKHYSEISIRDFQHHVQNIINMVLNSGGTVTYWYDDRWNRINN